MKPLVLAGRLIFGAWMLASGVNHFIFSLWTPPAGHEPLAAQLMSALIHSGLLGVAMTIQLVTGALILSGFFVPVALCVVMPITTCALYWTLILDHQPIGVFLGLAAFALNGLLMLAYIDYYAEVLKRSAQMFGDSSAGMSFDVLYVNAAGRTSRGEFALALLMILAVAAFYAFLVKGRNAEWCLLMLLFPAVVLHARRLHDMGQSAWPLAIPALLTVAAFAIWLHLVNFGAMINVAVPVTATVVFAGFALWGCMGAGQPEANRFGVPVAA